MKKLIKRWLGIDALNMSIDNALETWEGDFNELFFQFEELRKTVNCLKFDYIGYTKEVERLAREIKKLKGDSTDSRLMINDLDNRLNILQTDTVSFKLFDEAGERIKALMEYLKVKAEYEIVKVKDEVLRTKRILKIKKNGR